MKTICSTITSLGDIIIIFYDIRRLMISDGIIAINGDGCFLISSSCNKTFLNPSDISFIHCFQELFRTFISNTFATIQFLYLHLLLIDQSLLDIPGMDTYYLTYQFSLHFWESFSAKTLQGMLGCLSESWKTESIRLCECVVQLNNCSHCYIPAFNSTTARADRPDSEGGQIESQRSEVLNGSEQKTNRVNIHPPSYSLLYWVFSCFGSK